MQVIAEHPDLDLILLDLNLPDRDGFSVLTELGERYPALSVVVLSAQQDRGNVARALDLGAVGFIPKSGQREVLVSALQLVFAGGIYIPPEILARDQPLARQPDEKQPAANRPSVSPADLGLTDRQVDVLSLMMQGKSNKAICRVLNLAEPTVKNHVTAILKALKPKEPPQEPPEPAPAPRDPPPTAPKNLSGGAVAEQPVISTPET